MKQKIEKTYTVAEIAKKKKVSRQAVYLWIDKGLITKKEKIAGYPVRTVMTLQDVEDYLQSTIKE